MGTHDNTQDLGEGASRVAEKMYHSLRLVKTTCQRLTGGEYYQCSECPFGHGSNVACAWDAISLCMSIPAEWRDERIRELAQCFGRHEMSWDRWPDSLT